MIPRTMVPQCDEISKWDFDLVHVFFISVRPLIGFAYFVFCEFLDATQKMQNWKAQTLIYNTLYISFFETSKYFHFEGTYDLCFMICTICSLTMRKPKWQN